MKKILRKLLIGIAAIGIPAAALAQIVQQQPFYINPGTATDLGNGPIELQLTQGNALISTSSGSGVGSTSGAATLVTLTATPTTVPCVGCLLTAAANPSLTSVTIPTFGTVAPFVTAFNGGLQVTMSTFVTIGAGTPLAWGSACPTTPGAVLPLQAAVGGDKPFYTSARVCGYSPNGPGAAVLTLPIGAH